ncbi:hypothetical protein ACF08M_38345, partial [Streptomyces sp. NPDC015032]
MTAENAAPWEWVTDPQSPLWCVTFTSNATVTEVLRRYGTFSQRPRLQARVEVADLYEQAFVQGSVLRAGSLGTWSFCYEDAGAAGSLPGPLEALS